MNKVDRKIALKMHKDGATFNEIGKRFGVTRMAVCKAIKSIKRCPKCKTILN